MPMEKVNVDVSVYCSVVGPSGSVGTGGGGNAGVRRRRRKWWWY